MVTPLLTQLTYEGLLDEIFGIQNCMVQSTAFIIYHLESLMLHMCSAHIKVDPSLLSAAPPTSTSAGTPGTPGISTSVPLTSTAQTKKSHHLTSADPVFAQLRDVNFAVVGGKLNKEARRLDAEYKVCVDNDRDIVGPLNVQYG